MHSTRAVIALLATLTLASSAQGQRADDWPTFRKDRDRSGNAGGELPTSLDVLWQHRGAGEGASFSSSPAYSNGRVVIGMANHSFRDASGRVVCLDGKSGKRLWSTKTRHPVFSSPAIVGGRVYIGEGFHHNIDCRLYCIDLETGDLLWTFEAQNHIESSPTVKDGRVYFGAGDDGVYCVDANDGTKIWRHPGEHVDVSPLVTSGFVYAGSGYGDCAMFCISAATGERVWRERVALSVWGNTVRVGNRVFFGIGNGDFGRSAPNPQGAVVSLSAVDGKVVWRTPVPDSILTALAYDAGRLYLGCRDGYVYALRAVDGEQVWRARIGSVVVSSPVVSKKRIAAVSNAGRVAIVSKESGAVITQCNLRERLGESVRVYSSPAAVDGTLYLGAGRFVVALGAKANAAR